MAALHDVPDGFPAHSGRRGAAPVEGLWAPGEHVHVTRDVVEPLLRRADLLSQILRLGYAHDLRGQEV